MLVWFNSLLSILAVSLISLVGVFFLALRKEKLQEIQMLLVAMATGGLLGGAFFHLLPESFESFKNVRYASFLLVFGFMLFFVLERFLHWSHDHISGISNHHNHPIKPLGTVNLIADGFHNMLDGILIAASYSYSFDIGLATTLIVIMHELPQEIGDFAVLLHAGFTRKKALIFNFISACAAFLGGFIVLLFEPIAHIVSKAIIPIAAGGFLYLAAADLIPELHNEKTLHKSFYQFLALLFGICLLFVLSALME
jgi:zinc and cadmium transporter